MGKNILILSTLDERGNGHGWSRVSFFRELGFHVEFICLYRKYSDTDNYIIDSINKLNLGYLWYSFIRFLEKLPFLFSKNVRGLYKGIDFSTASQVLKKTHNKPDYILLYSYQLFLSPKEILKLYKKTGATLIIIMVDEKLLGGGCAYPEWCDGQGYIDGCRNCPVYPYAKFIPREIFKQKEHYFRQIPFHIVGTQYDINKIKDIHYLNDKVFHTSVGVPKIPFVKTKKEARYSFNISENDFVIMAGAVSAQNRKKGFSELLESLLIFSNNVIKEKPVTLLILGNDFNRFCFPSNIKICTPGFLDLQGLFTAYYACDIYVSPSLLDSGPYMVNYAMACGRPVIAFPVGVALDLIIPQQTGWIAKRNDTKDFAKGISLFYGYNQNELTLIEKQCIDHLKSYEKHPWYEFMLNP